MVYAKEKRTFTRKPLKDARGFVELKEERQEVAIINASKGGVCIAGTKLPVGRVVRLYLDVPKIGLGVPLYCKVVWAASDQPEERGMGLSFLNTNKILFKEEFASFSKFIDSLDAGYRF
ncbi:MAG: PilZ domain-containing protein [Deltaproteobacteria bacterium]|nr:PilZ domain-containing protein [Deltaproteobacteria bacterium]